MTTVNVTWVAYQYDGQNRLYVNSNHADGSICYKDAALTNNGSVFGLDQSFVAMATADDAYSFTFDLVEDKEGTDADVWSVTVEVVRGAKHEQQTAPCTVYFSGSKMVNVLDANGECYVSAWGMENAGAFSLKLEDDNQRAYAATTLESAKTAAADYIDTANKASDLAGMKAAMEKKGALETAMVSLRGNDKTAYSAKLAEGDKIMESKQDIVKGVVLAEYNKVAAATAVFEDEKAITTDSIAAAVSALNAANAVYADTENLLNNENKAYFTAIASDYAYEIDYAKACQSVVACESKVAGLDTLSAAECLAVIAEVRTTYANYEGSEMQGLINALNETDKAAMEARLVALVTTAEEAASALKADVQAKYDAAKTAVEAMEAEKTEAKAAAAKTALETADAQYETVKELFSEEEQGVYAAASLDYSTRIAAVEKELNKVPEDSSSSETTDSTDKAEDSSSSENVDATVKDESSDNQEEESSGCGSTLGGIGAMATLVAAAAMFIVKKKD